MEINGNKKYATVVSNTKSDILQCHEIICGLLTFIFHSNLLVPFPHIQY